MHGGKKQLNWFDRNFDPKFVKVCIYASITMLVTVALILLMYNSGPALLMGWNTVAKILEPFVYGMLICYVLLPVVRWVTERLATYGIFKNNFVRRLHIAVFITVLLVALIVAAIAALLLLVITRSVESVNLQTLQELFNSAEGDITYLIRKLQEIAREVGLVSEESGTTITGTIGELTDVFSTVVFSIIFGVYFLLDGARVFNYARRIFIAVFGGWLVPDVSQFLEDADNAFAGYLRGQFVDAVLVGTTTALTFTIIGVPYGPIIGLLTGIGNLIPYVGGPVGYVTTVLVCLAEGDFSKLLAGLVALSIIMFIDGNVLNPRLLSNAVEIHPLLVIVALIAGSAVGGPAGMLIAVPTAAFLKVQLDRWLAERESYLDLGAHFRSEPRVSSVKADAIPEVPEDDALPVELADTGSGVTLDLSYTEDDKSFTDMPLDEATE